jgi:hypothetical protein
MFATLCSALHQSFCLARTCGVAICPLLKTLPFSLRQDYARPTSAKVRHCGRHFKQPHASLCEPLRQGQIDDLLGSRCLWNLYP